MSDMEQYGEVFREEAFELLTELESTLLELEERPDDMGLVARAFRAMHTIKGSAAMFNLDHIAAFTHKIETVFDQVRNGKMLVTAELAGLALQAKDLIRAMLEGPPEAVANDQEQLLANLQDYQQAASGAAAGTTIPAKQPTADKPPAANSTLTCSENSGPARIYRIIFRPGQDLLQEGINPLDLITELCKLGTCRTIAYTRDGKAIGELTDKNISAAWDAILSTTQDQNAIRDVFAFVEDRADIKIDLIDDGQAEDTLKEYKKIGEILIERGDLTCEQLKDALAAQKRVGELLVEKGFVEPAKIQAAIVEQKVVREERTKRETTKNQAEATNSIRVAADKLDSLVDRVGELVIAQARLTQIATIRMDSELAAVAEEIERLSAELRDNTLNIRMVAIGTTFSRFKRLVRDLSAELGKEIELVTEGAETELDKTVIERLGDPLVHLIRNSCDHGIETPEIRQSKGKPARGTVRLAAYHSGPNVFIEISDDGAGLDPDVLHAKAVEKGLIPADAKLSDKEAFNLIFLAGLSTAKNVSNVSGRGVGMDVVKRSIDALRGTVEINSTLGNGTTIRIKLPLTLAIIEGLLVAVGENSYVIPLALVEECVELNRKDVEKAHGNHLAVVRGELVPYLRLREAFSVNGTLPEIEQVVVANVEGLRFGFVVDHVIGQHQTVIKALGKIYKDVEGLSGATILGDGSMALILDTPSLMKTAEAVQS